MTDLATTPLSRFAISDLAIQSAVELERARAGSGFDRDTLEALAAALAQSSKPERGAAAFRFVEPVFYEPFERLYQAHEAHRGGVEELQAFFGEVAGRLRAVPARKADPESLSNLVGFCVALHREMIRNGGEDAIAVRDWRGSDIEGPAGVR